MNDIDIRTTHSFNVLLAEEIGIQKALLIRNIEYWITENKRKNINFHDDEYWTFESSPQLAKKYTYMKETSIRRWMLELEKQGWIKSGSYSKNVYDRTKWYTLGTKYIIWLDKHIVQHSTVQNERSTTVQNERSTVEDERSLNVSMLNHQIINQNMESLSSRNDDKKNDNDDSFFKNIKKQYAEKYDIEALLFEARCRLDRRKEKGDIANPVGYLKITVKNMIAEELEKYSLVIRKQKADEEKKELELIQQQEEEVLKQNSEKKRIEEKIEKVKKKRIQTKLRTPKEADIETYLASLTKFQRKIAKSDITADKAFIAWFRSREIGTEINFLEKNLTKEEFEYYISSVDLEQ